jgi:Protein of unknown function (DUF2523)
MFGIFLSALNVILGWVFRSLLVKFGVFFALYFITSEFMGLIVNLIPSTSSVSGTMSGIGSATWYFLNVFMLTQGISLVVSAYATRFVIRRIPVIG